MLLKASGVLLLAWIIGVAGLYDLGDLVHMFLLLAMMLGGLGSLPWITSSPYLIRSSRQTACRGELPSGLCGSPKVICSA